MAIAATATNNETMTVLIFNELTIKASNQMTKIALAYAHRTLDFTMSRKVTKESLNLAKSPIFFFTSMRNFKVLKLRFVSNFNVFSEFKCLIDFFFISELMT